MVPRRRFSRRNGCGQLLVAAGTHVPVSTGARYESVPEKSGSASRVLRAARVDSPAAIRRNQGGRRVETRGFIEGGLYVPDAVAPAPRNRPPRSRALARTREAPAPATPAGVAPDGAATSWHCGAGATSSRGPPGPWRRLRRRPRRRPVPEKNFVVRPSSSCTQAPGGLERSTLRALLLRAAPGRPNRTVSRLGRID